MGALAEEGPFCQTTPSLTLRRSAVAPASPIGSRAKRYSKGFMPSGRTVVVHRDRPADRLWASQHSEVAQVQDPAR